MWAIYNKDNERMFQYGTFIFEDIALRTLKNAQERNPDAGFKLKKIK